VKAVRWDEIPDELVRPGIRRRGFGTREVLLVMNHCEPGMDLRPHSHEFDQIAMITKGRALYHIGEELNEVGPGSLMLIAAGVEHYIEPLGDAVVENIDIFAPAREDYLHLVEWMRDRD
jgi:quercetin dioxygenase-like cupin family protein